MRSVVAFVLSILLTAALLIGLLYALVGNFSEFDFSIPLLSDSTVVLENKDSPDFAEPTKPKPKPKPKPDTTEKEAEKGTPSDTTEPKPDTTEKETENKTPSATTKPKVEQTEPEDVEEDIKEIVFPESNNKQATFLFIGMDYRKDFRAGKRVTADSILLLKIDKVKKSFMFSAIPANTVAGDTENTTFLAKLDKENLPPVVEEGQQVQEIKIPQLKDILNKFNRG